VIPLAPVLSVLRAVPLWAWALGAAVAWGGWHRWRAIDAREDFQRAQVQAQAEHAAQIARDTAETQRRTKTIMEAADAATIQSQADRVAAEAARAAADRLRARLAAQADAGARDSAAAGSCEAARAAAAVQADVLGRVADAARQLGEHADAARTAGSACERAYEGLRR
jgi:Protein of unknown function (DUF2514)